MLYISNLHNYDTCNIMGERLPLTIRRQVIKQWLDGHSRDKIAKDNDIGAGTVYCNNQAMRSGKTGTIFR